MACWAERVGVLPGGTEGCVGLWGWGSGSLSGKKNQGVCQSHPGSGQRFPRDGPVTAVTVPLMTGAVAGHTP